MDLIRSARTPTLEASSDRKGPGFVKRYKRALWKSRAWVGGSIVSLIGFPLIVVQAIELNEPAVLLGALPALVGMLLCAAKSASTTDKILDELYAPLGINRSKTFSESNFESGNELDSFNCELKDGRRGIATVISMGEDETPRLIFSEISPTAMVLESGSLSKKELTA